MKKYNLQSSYDWVDFTQLQRSMSRQNKDLPKTHKTDDFDPHKYFGGWEPIERTSIERIKMDDRLKEMMEYEASSAALSRSCSNSFISESLANPSVAEELEPSQIQPKANNLFDFKVKSEITHKNDDKSHKPK